MHIAMTSAGTGSETLKGSSMKLPATVVNHGKYNVLKNSPRTQCRNIFICGENQRDSHEHLGRFQNCGHRNFLPLICPPPLVRFFRSRPNFRAVRVRKTHKRKLGEVEQTVKWSSHFTSYRTSITKRLDWLSQCRLPLIQAGPRFLMRTVRCAQI